MKKISFLALAAVGLLFGACASDSDVAEKENSGQATQYDQAFVGISIELPNTLTPTRANDDLNNGKADEFEVKDATLLLFKGNAEGTATYLGAWSLTNNFQNDTQGADVAPGTKVTQTSVSVAQIDNLSLLPSENLYAYVIVNKNEVPFPSAGSTFDSWRATTFAANKIGSEYDATNKTDKVSAAGLMMTNAPISATAGGSAASTGAVTTAVVLDKSKIAKTADAAKSAPAGCVYVERSAAKLTVAMSSGTGVIELEDPSGADMAAEIDAFQIINTEPKYYNTRNSDNADWLGYNSPWCINTNTKYRFVSLQQFSPTLPSGGTHTTGFRTYFAQDPQYSATATLNNTVATDGGNWIAPDGRAFMPENTFDVANMTRQNTTQATIRMKFNNGVSFYSISNEATLYAAADINNAIVTHVQTLYAISTWMEDAKNYVLSQLDLAEPSKTHTATVSITAAVPTTEVAGDQAYTLSYNIAATEDGSPVSQELSDALKTAWTTAVASAKADYKVTLYKDGISYYNVRIQHFGEAETPWDSQTEAGVIKVQPGETVAQIYGYTADASAQTVANNRFLGRYGVVRDNWYQLTVDQIKKLGSATPTPVNGDTTPDDEIGEELYIACHVHILPWVLRKQSVKF